MIFGIFSSKKSKISPIKSRSDFIDKKTVWWKLEAKFERVFVEWLALPSYGNVKLEGKVGDYPKEDYDSKPLPLLSLEVKKLVKEYYKEDYERFNYAIQ